ncbi:MAG: SBBP repeat-containing protein, partial [Bacteroidota bacterium]
MNRLIYSFVETASRNAFLLCLSGLILFPQFASAQIEWARQSNPSAGAGGSAQGNDIAIDALGNTYVVGDYTGEVLLGTHLLDNDGSVYLAKYTPFGHLAWVRFITGNSNNDGLTIALDASGAVYIAGQYSHT